MRVAQACFQSSAVRAALPALLVSACCPPVADTSQEQASHRSAQQQTYAQTSAYTYPATDVPKLGRLRIIPDTLHVYAPVGTAIQQFELRVQLEDIHGRIIPEFYRDHNGSILQKSFTYRPTWGHTGGTYVQITDVHHRAKLQLMSSTPHGQTFKVRAWIGSIIDEAVVTVIRNPALVSEKVVSVPNNAVQPTVVLAESNFWPHDLRALIDAGATRKYALQSSDRQVVALARDKGIGLQLTKYAASPVNVDLAGVRTVPVTVWVAAEDSNGKLAQHAVMDIALASQIYKSNGVGLQFTVTNIEHLEPVEKIRKTYSGCQDSSPNVYKPLGSTIGLTTSSGTLYVVYVESIYGTAKAFTCDHTVASGAIIVVSRKDYTPTDIAHELGHALSLRDEVGHVDKLPKFKRTNILTAWLDHNSAANRDHIAAGQAYRMNLDKLSWFNFDPSGDTAFELKGLTLQCPQVDSYPTCPRLYLDVTH